MAINSCVINCTPINELCSSRRTAIIAALGGNSPGGLPVGRAFDRLGQREAADRLRYEYQQRQEREVKQDTHLQLQITIDGQTYQQTVEKVDTVVPLISIFAMQTVDTVSVNITDVEISTPDVGTTND